MNTRILELIRTKYETQQLLHITNVKNLLANPVGVAEHPDIVATIEGELEKIADCEDLIQATYRVLPKNST